jgi:methyl-accepting chemotaxis protein
MATFRGSLAGRIHFSPRSQILLLGLTGVAAIGTIYLISLQVETKSQRAADEFGTLALLTAKVSEGLLQCREMATEFLQKPDEAKVAAHAEVLKATVGHLADIERLTESLPEGDPIRQANSFRATINNYTTRFSNVASAQKLIGFNENDGLQGKLRAAVHTVEGQLKTYDQPRLANLMLMMRRNEKDFMLRGDEKYGDELRKRADEFSIELAKANIPAESRAEISKLVDAYKTSFLAFMAGQSTLIEEAADLAQIYDRSRPILVAVRNATDERLASVKAELASVKRYVFWSICLTVLVMATSAYLLGRRLSTPLVKMATAMDLLAQGDLDSKIDPINRRDEIGKISSALSVFQQKLLENRQLTAEQARLQQRAEVDRRETMLQVADRFEQEIGKVIQSVSTASAEIESAAGSLTKTAETTQELSTVVAAASQQSSASVQSAAAAAEQMVCSVTEIGRQVQESQKVANAAVEQAEQTNLRIAELSQSADRISEVVKLISAVAAQSVQRAAQGAAEVSGNIADVTRGATDTGSSAEQVHGAAQELLNESNHLKSEVVKFLASVRAA